jgi:hypothetical protein
VTRKSHLEKEKKNLFYLVGGGFNFFPCDFRYWYFQPLSLVPIDTVLFHDGWLLCSGRRRWWLSIGSLAVIVGVANKF